MLAHFVRCVMCHEPVTRGVHRSTPPDPICSDRCWGALRELLQIDGLPSGIPRDEAIKVLALAGRHPRYIAAHFGLSVGRVRDIIKDEPPVRHRHSSKLSTGWLLGQRP